MKKWLAALCLLTISAFAQVGIVRTTSGIHAPSAKILPQGSLFISGSFEMVSDGNALSVEEGYTDNNGNFVNIDKNTPSNNENLYASFAIKDNFELGFFIPLHYDGDIRETNLKGIGFGDIELTAKTSFSLNEWIFLGLSGEILAPTGSRDKGFRPRHRWYIKSNDNAYAYTSNQFALNANLHLTMDFGDFLSFNGAAGILKDFDEDINYALWAAGFNVFPEKTVTVILEASGEMPLRSSNLKYNFLSSPFRLTPGLRVHLPYETYLTISGDVGLKYINKDDKDNVLPVDLKTRDEDIKYSVKGSPNVGIAVSISKVIDLSWADDDNDGVINRKDMCPGTLKGQAVNARGCPVDEDQDGVLNIVDLCLGTPFGQPVDYNGCPLDHDGDGVPDYLDNCSLTPEGYAVDSVGCTKDSDDDGIDDNNDKCPNTLQGERVGKDGCLLDQDHDGIPNEHDQCPETPEGISIDAHGCPLDFDGDGIPDDIDKCPNSKLGESVDLSGCPLDEDNDGVPDTKDQCPETPHGVSVNKLGCRIDQDEDGIFDEDDKCPGTPNGAPVDSLGCPLDNDMDGIPDWADICPGTFPNTAIDMQGCPLNSKLNFNNIAAKIRFKGNSATLYNSSYTALNDIIHLMRQHPMNLEIECSASDISGESASQIATERATAIYEYLVYKGIHESRLKFSGFGSRLPPTLTQKAGSTDIVRLTPSLQVESK